MRPSVKSGGSGTGSAVIAKGGRKLAMMGSTRPVSRLRGQSGHLRLLRLARCRPRATLAPALLKVLWEGPSPSTGSFRSIKTPAVERNARESQILWYLARTPLSNLLVPPPFPTCKSRNLVARFPFLCIQVLKPSPMVPPLPRNLHRSTLV